MAYSQTIDLVQGDLNPQLTIYLRDSNQPAQGKVLDEADSNTWLPIDLTDGKVTMRIREVGKTDIKDTLVANLANAKNGQATFLFNETTLDQSGTFEAEIEFTDQYNRPQTVVDLIRLRVRAQF